MDRQRLVVRFVLRRLRRRPLRALLIVLLVAAPVATATVAEVVYRTAHAREREIAREFGTADAKASVLAERRTRGPGISPAALTKLLPPGGRAAADASAYPAEFLGRTHGHLAIGTLVVASFDEPLVRHRARLASGRAPDPAATHPEAVVSTALARRLGLLDGGGLRGGATLALDVAGTTRARVVGFVYDPGCLPCETAIVPPGSPLETFLLSNPEAPNRDLRYWENRPAYALLVDLPEGADVAAVRANLHARGIGLWTPEESQAYLGADTELRQPALTALLAGLVLLQVVLLAGAAFAIGARRQAGEVGLFAAHGAGPRQVRRVVLAEAVVLGVSGAAAGVATGLLALAAGRGGWEWHLGSAIDAWYGRPSEIAAVAALAVLGVVAAALVPAALVPAATAGRCTPVDAMAGRIAGPTGRRIRSATGVLLCGLGGAVAIRGSAGLDEGLARHQARHPGATSRPNLLRDADGNPDVLLVLAGSAGVVVGLTLLAPTLLALLARGVAPLPAPCRLAVRAAARHDSRAAPAACAIAIAVAVAGAAAVTSATADSADGDTRSRFHENIVRVSDPERTAASQRRARAAADAVAAVLPNGRAFPLLNVALPNRVAPPAAMSAGTAPDKYKSADPFLHPSTVPRAPKASGRPSASRTALQLSAPCVEPCSEVLAELKVADPALVALLATGRADAAVERTVRAALDAGKVVVLNPALLDRFGRVTVYDTPPEATGYGHLAAVLIPPAGDRRGVEPNAFVSAAKARSLGWATSPGDTLVAHDPAGDDLVQVALGAGIDAGMSMYTAGMYGDGLGRSSSLPRRVGLAATAFVALLGVGIPLLLAPSDGLGAAATLAAIGGTSRRRRRFTVAQALLLAGLGTAAGLALGLGFARAARPATGSAETVLPWGEVGLLVAIVGAVALAVGLAASARRPVLTRRAD